MQNFQILKNRFCGEVGKVPLEFDKTSLRFTQQKSFPQGRVGQADKARNTWSNITVLG